MLKLLFVIFSITTAHAQIGPNSNNQFVINPPVGPNSSLPIGPGTPLSSVVVFTALHTYFMAPTTATPPGNDANSGLDAAHPWATPNHAVVCGDAIIAAAGTYGAFNTSIGGSSGTAVAPSGCPSTSGGIDGTGGIYAAAILCATPFACICQGALLTDICFDIAPSGADTGNWAVISWTMKTSAAANSTGEGIKADALNETLFTVHHVMPINNIITTNAVGIDAGSNEPGSLTTKSWDYLAALGNIVQNSNIHNVCLGAINLNGPSNYDTNAGTHVYVNTNYVWSNNTTNTACGAGSDEEGVLIDTWDLHGYTQQLVISHLIIFTSTGFGLQFVYSNNFAEAVPMKVHNLTLYDNDVSYPTNPCTGCTLGDVSMQSGGGSTPMPWAIVLQNIISKTARATSNSGILYALNVSGGTNAAVTIGGTGNENIFNASATICGGTCDSGSAPFNVNAQNGASFGTNIYVDPSFANVSDLITNRNGVPNCTGFPTTTACMGWNAVTKTLTTPSTISDLVAGCAQCTGKGYQLPSATCAPNAEYPAFLKGLNVLVWNAALSQITENPGLASKPCGM